MYKCFLATRLDEFVNIFADLDGKCSRGSLVQYTGSKVFVGLGTVKMTRKQIFEGINNNPQ